MIDKQDALRWLEVQRDAINTEIAYAAPDDKGQYFGNLKIVNWLVDKVNDMTAVEYLQTTRQICECNSQFKCNGCPFSARTVEDEMTCICGELQVYESERAVEIVKRWKEEQL